MNTADFQLQAARQELLYLGLRNPLIHYRHYTARGVEVVQERPSHIVRLLADEGREMSFLPVREGQESMGTEEGALIQPEEERHEDLFLQTGYGSAVLQKRLLNSYYLARSTIEEQGVNILYLALGMLHWYERDNSEVLRRAPLVLLPVELVRQDANSPFHLRYTGTDIGDNLSLRLKLRLDFGLELPALDTDALNLPDYFGAVATAVASMPHWRVDDTAVALAFFSFNKFLMYNDLDPAHWSDTPPAQHPTLQALLSNMGFPSALASEDSQTTELFENDLAQSYQVVDADSSQTLAIMAVNEGHNLVIQGPPGTGKSQTITNLMAEAMGRGKTVLFVSEKLAALEVVKRRLDEVGLGDAALALHSHKTTKRTFLDELERTWCLGQPKADGRFPDLPHLQEIRDDLNAYHQAMNTAVGRSGLTAFHAYGRFLQLQAQLNGLDVPELDTQSMLDWSQAEFEAQLARVAEIQDHLRQMGVPQEHTFWACGQGGGGEEAEAPEVIEEIRRLSLAAQETLRGWQMAAARLAEQLQVPVPAGSTAVEQLCVIGQRLLGAPNLFAVDVRSELWHTEADRILSALEAGQRIEELRAHFSRWLIPEAWAEAMAPNVLAIRMGLMAGRSRWGRFFSRAYQRAKGQLAGLCRTTVPDEWQVQIDAVDAILEVQRQQPKLDEMTATLAQLFGIRWQGLESDWSRLLTVALWLTRLHKEIVAGERPYSLLNYVTRKIDKPILEVALAEIEKRQVAYETDAHELQQFLGIKKGGEERPFTHQLSQLQRFYNEAERWPEWVAYQALIEQWASQQVQHPLSTLQSQLIQIANSWAHAGNYLTVLWQYSWLRGLVDRAQGERPILLPTNQAEKVDAFCELDSAFLRHNRLRLMHDHWARLSRYEAGGQSGWLQKEMAKKRQHIPIRQLMDKAGRAVQRLKPIFMMSPLSIAMFLPPQSLTFDLVIFDEASQVRPVDAFGAILRGRQTVVVGDSHQLPPTIFFETVAGETKSGEEEIQESGGAGEQGRGAEPPLSLPSFSSESILDLFLAQNAPERMLRWHYRSQHESLIAVSNREFYERQLVIFPSPDAAREEVGLVYHHLPQTTYDRGGTRTNVQEAMAVAMAVIQHAQQQPHLTLGVVAFSSSQREAIEEEVERLRRQYDAAESFFQAHPIEPFFVKNLENVQGDERDVILISVGYGRSADGRLSMNFGPLNQVGGERRLNVLITRARRRCEIFANLTADDIDLTRTEAVGVAALKTYLAYAQTGQLAELAPTMWANRSPLVEVVATALRERGYTVDQPLNEMVDLAVQDAKRPSRYHLGLQLDGGRPPSARDRERIQPQVLRSLGWRFYRLWGSRWWQDAAAELEHLINTMSEAELKAPPGSSPFHLERYGPLPLGEPRDIPDYIIAHLTIRPKARRKPWILDKNSGRYYYALPQPGSYEFDAAARRFVMGGRRPFQLQSTLQYYFETDQFTFSTRFVLRMGKEIYNLFFDEESGRFYENSFDSKRQRWRKVKRVFDPMSGTWREVDDAPRSFARNQQLATLVAPELAAEVRLEAEWVAQIVAVESPIHVEELERRLAQAAGLSRRTSTTKEIVRLAGIMALKDRRYMQHGDFFYATNSERIPVRDRSNLPDVSRAMTLIAPEEIETAVQMVVTDAVSIVMGQVPEQVGRLLGFRNVGTAAWRQIYDVVMAMVADGRLRRQDQEVMLA